jgi:hypothetical protein
MLAGLKTLPVQQQQHSSSNNYGVTPGNLTFKQAKARMLSTILAAGTNA